MLVAQYVPHGVLVVLETSYFAGLGAVMTRQIAAARVWPRLGFVVGVAGLGVGDAATLAGMRGMIAAPQLHLAMVLYFAVLLTIIGGRAIPAFGESWRRQSGASWRVRRASVPVALAASLTALAGSFILMGNDVAAGYCLFLAGGLQMAALAGWQSVPTRRHPSLLMLHAAWFWVPAAQILIGYAILHPEVIAYSTALHALTMGAMGCMILAIAGRAAMARQGNRLIASRGLLLAFSLVWLSAPMRLLSPFITTLVGFDPIVAAAVLWISGWAAFLVSFVPALRGEVPWPILSARQPH